MTSFSRIRKKNFGFHRKILRLKRLREANFPHVLYKYKKGRKNRESTKTYSFRSFNSLYNQSPKLPRKDNQKRYNTSGGNSRHDGWYNNNHRNFCTDCNHSQYNMNSRCTQCGSDKIICLHIDARVPKKNANKKTWANFRELFVDFKLKDLEN